MVSVGCAKPIHEPLGSVGPGFLGAQVVIPEHEVTRRIAGEIRLELVDSSANCQIRDARLEPANAHLAVFQKRYIALVKQSNCVDIHSPSHC